jgi:hypothetical protein
MKIKYLIGLFVFGSMLSCSKSDPSPAPDPGPDPVPDPVAATLVFPDNNTECNEGVVLNDTQSSVAFQWNASANTDSYEVTIRNLDTNTSATTNTTTNEAVITLLRGVPYEWFVVSKASGTTVTATSDKWKFYNQGPGVENYAPFPAEVVSPLRGSSIASSGTIALEWAGSDVDNDITEYEILFGTDAMPSTSLGTTSDTTLDATIVSGEIYYWRVITMDSQGNTSQSEIFDFRVD